MDIYLSNFALSCGQCTRISIARTMPKGLVYESWHELAPSEQLFRMYLRWKSEGNWNAHTFNEMYVPRFILDTKRSQAARNRLNWLWQHRNDNITYELLCWCGDEAICHRSIIGGLLLGTGISVHCNADYAKYYDMYKEVTL